MFAMHRCTDLEFFYEMTATARNTIRRVGSTGFERYYVVHLLLDPLDILLDQDLTCMDIATLSRLIRGGHLQKRDHTETDAMNGCTPRRQERKGFFLAALRLCERLIYEAGTDRVRTSLHNLSSQAVVASDTKGADLYNDG